MRRLTFQLGLPFVVVCLSRVGIDVAAAGGQTCTFDVSPTSIVSGRLDGDHRERDGQQCGLHVDGDE